MTRLSLICLCALAACPAWAQRGSASLSASSRDYAQLTLQMREIQQGLQALHAKLDALEQQQTSLAMRVGALERGTGVATKDELAALRTDLNAIQARQEKMRGEIVSDLSERMAKIAKTQEKPQKPQPQQKSGYNHVVEAGETLSAIAEAYNVPVKTIMKANNVSDPTKLRVGQKLFIPDP